MCTCIVHVRYMSSDTASTSRKKCGGSKREVYSIAISYTVEQGLSDVRYRGLLPAAGHNVIQWRRDSRGVAHRAVRSDTDDQPVTASCHGLPERGGAGAIWGSSFLEFKNYDVICCFRAKYPKLFACAFGARIK